ncbi:MAG: hypothetical protein ACE5KF_12430, partial [Kiloniellaceae bacterium]
VLHEPAMARAGDSRIGAMGHWLLSFFTGRSAGRFPACAAPSTRRQRQTVANEQSVCYYH